MLTLEYSLCEVWSLVIHSLRTAAGALKRSHAPVVGYTYLRVV